jgi:hypothetical protein
MILLKTLPTLFFEGTVSPAFSTPVFFSSKELYAFLRARMVQGSACLH